ncbi:serine/threonine-protein kinase [Polyangium jinanense]|uniref:Protein kinase n=1 Tax=Polyangium jinanense TaxID=2829994 RepID=A0A9X3XHA8_9BACT|nr:serine/threonine-protein kinase [Polyangium jinanense]MDC3962929.1 protein kinase [Polyangium jinanense]MDC3989068.1 protein kinase [Polyangium jinanense]
MSESLGGFTIEGVLGEGGSAIVYAARRDGRDLALKVMKGVTDERQCARFLAEAELLARVKHPNVVEIVEAGALPDGAAFLAMPRLRGETLAARIARGRLELGAAMACFEELARGVAAVHDAGLIHRDLKPENVFLREDGSPILLDLGIGREAEAQPSTTTEEGVVRGTKATMAPERFFGSRATIASDVYELALVLYAMLVGRLPWSDAPDAQDRLHARPPSDLEPSIPAALSDAIMRALSTRVERRPSSVGELVTSLQTAIAEADAVPRRTARAPVIETTPASPADLAEGTKVAPAPPQDRPSARRDLGRVVPRRAILAATATAVSFAAVALGWVRSRGAEAPALAASGLGALAAAPSPSLIVPSSSLVIGDPSAAPVPTGSDDDAIGAASASVPTQGNAPRSQPAKPLAWCKKIIDLDCDPKLGSWARAKCSRDKSDVARFEKLPPGAWPAIDAECAKAYAKQKAYVEEQKAKQAGVPVITDANDSKTVIAGRNMPIWVRNMPSCRALLSLACDSSLPSATSICQKTRAWVTSIENMEAVEARCRDALPTTRALIEHDMKARDAEADAGQ